MQHCEPGTLARFATGEEISAQTSAHLDECMWCGAEAGSLKELIANLREPQAVASIAPEPALWQAISEATGVSLTPSAVIVEAAPVASQPGAMAAADQPADGVGEMAMPGSWSGQRAPVNVPAVREGDGDDVWNVDSALAEYGGEEISWENPKETPHTPIAATTPGAGAGVPRATSSPVNRPAPRGWVKLAAVAAVALAVGGAGGVVAGRATADDSTQVICPATP